MNKTDTSKASPRPWVAEYDNDTGPNDDYFQRFWRVTDAIGGQVATVYDENALKVMLEVVNAHDHLRAIAEAAREYDDAIGNDSHEHDDAVLSCTTCERQSRRRVALHAALAKLDAHEKEAGR